MHIAMYDLLNETASCGVHLRCGYVYKGAGTSKAEDHVDSSLLGDAIVSKFSPI